MTTRKIPDGMRRLHFELPAELAAALARRAEADHRTIRATVELILREALKGAEVRT